MSKYDLPNNYFVGLFNFATIPIDQISPNLTLMKSNLVDFLLLNRGLQNIAGEVNRLQV